MFLKLVIGDFYFCPWIMFFSYLLGYIIWGHSDYVNMSSLPRYYGHRDVFVRSNVDIGNWLQQILCVSICEVETDFDTSSTRVIVRSEIIYFRILLSEYEPHRLGCGWLSRLKLRIMAGKNVWILKIVNNLSHLNTPVLLTGYMCKNWQIFKNLTSY